MKAFDIILVGVGGQGVLTVAEIISQAAADAGLAVSYYPSKGMAQRGGFVKAQVRLGRDSAGPNLPEHGAGLAVALERSEALKALRFARPGADFVLFDDPWQPAGVVLGKASYPTTEEVCAQIAAAGTRLLYAAPACLPLYEGRPAPDNVFVLGLAVGQTALRDLLDPGRVAEHLAGRWPKAAGANLFAFRAGMEYAPERHPSIA